MTDFNSLNKNEKKEIYKIFFKNNFRSKFNPSFIFTSFKYVFFETPGGMIEARKDEIKKFYIKNIDTIRIEKLNKIQNL